MERAQSTLTLSANSLPVGDHMINCSAGIDAVNVTQTSAQALVSVAPPLFDNITITANPVDVDLKIQNFTTIICTVESSLEPMFEFYRDGMEIAGDKPMLVNGVYSSQATVGSLTVGTVNVSCRSFLNITDAPPPLAVSICVNVTVLFEDISISTSVSDVTLGDGLNEVTATCSVESGVTPIFRFFVDSSEVFNATPPTSNSSLYSSSVSLTTADYFREVGSRVISCISSVPGDSLSANTSVTVGVVFANLSLVDDAGGEVVVSDPLDGNLTLTCSVLSSLMPDFAWTRNGNVINSSSAMDISDGFSSVLVIQEGDLRLPLERFECSASLNIPGGGVVNFSDVAEVSVSVNFTDILIYPQDVVVNVTGMSIDSPTSVVDLTCSVATSLPPVVAWSRSDGVTANGTAAVFVGGGKVESTLTVNAGEFRGRVNFTCTASLQESLINNSIVATTTLTVNGKSV